MRASVWVVMAGIAGCASTASAPPPDTAAGQSTSPAPGSGPAPAGGSGSDAGTADAGPLRHALHLSVTGNGTVSGASTDCFRDCQEQLDEGQTVHLIATPGPSFEFVGWQGDCQGAGACDLAMSADHAVTAAFAMSGSVLVKAGGSGGGRITSTPAGIDCPGACSAVFAMGTKVTLSAAPDGSSVFRGWGGACAGVGGVCELPAADGEPVWANFEASAPAPEQSCADVAPPDVPEVVQTVQQPWYGLGFDCGGGTSDLSGNLALLVNGGHGDQLDFVSALGAPLGSAGTSMGGFLVPQPTGFASVSGRPYLGPDWAIQHGQLVSAFDSAGRESGASTLGNYTGQPNLTGAADPNGGVLLAGELSMGPSSPAQHAAVMFEGGATAAAPRWGPVALDSVGAVYGAGVDLLGRSLIITNGTALFGSGTISAQWFDRDGTALTGEFVLLTKFDAGSPTWFETTALIGGGLLVRRMDGDSHATALVVLQSGGISAKPAPDWMVQRPDVKLQLARGGKAYAALPLAAAGVPCTQRVELIAPDGTSCGAADYPIADGTCDTHEMTLGADGTLIQQLPAALEQTNQMVGGHTCTWRWWRAAAR